MTSDKNRQDVDAELSFHLEMRVRELIERGMSEADARAEARRRFGNYTASRRECVEIDGRRRNKMKRMTFVTGLWQDFLYALRMHRRSPGFTIVAVLTLALGIGANSAIFSVVHGVLIESLPFKDPDQLYRVRTLYPDGTPYSLSAPDFASLRQDTTTFARIEAYTLSPMAMVGVGDPREVQGARVSDGLFDMLGIGMTAGRAFHPDDHRPGRGNIVVLSHGFWTREFGAERSVIGRTLSLGGRPYDVVGVLAPNNQLAGDLLAPLEYDATFQSTDQQARRSEFLAVIGRAKPGAGADTVGADLVRVGTALQKTFPTTNAGLTFIATPLREFILGDVKTPLWTLLGAVGFVLLVACANVASLLLARASARQQEIAVRAALGAGRQRLLRQLVTESVVLACAGGLAGLALAWAGTKALIAARPADIPRLDQIGLNWTVVLVTMGVAVGTGLLFGLFPAFQATRNGLRNSMSEAGRSGTASRGSHRLRTGLVIVEMSLAVVLLMGAGLLMRSFVELTRVPRGFDTDRGLTFSALLQGTKYQGAPEIRARVAEFESKLKSLTGVKAAAATTVVPLTSRGAMVNFAIDGAPPPPPNVNAEISLTSVTPDYFSAIGTPIVLGRGLNDRDTSDTPLVALINEAGVRHWFAGQNPVGKSVTAGAGSRQIVGVVGDIRQRNLRVPASPALYVPFAQRPARAPRFVVRLGQETTLQAATIRSAFREIDPDVALTGFVPFTSLVDDAVAQPRFYTSLLVLFAGIALALAAIGIFGVMSYTVAQRSREISIRLALGARANQVLTMIVSRALAMAGIGIALGTAATFALERVIRSQLFGVTVLDPMTLGGVAFVLGLSAAAASFFPARKAAGIDPGGVLR